MPPPDPGAGPRAQEAKAMRRWALVLAALVLAALPTLLVFIFCQNIIMRGIILPVEK